MSRPTVCIHYRALSGPCSECEAMSAERDDPDNWLLELIVSEEAKHLLDPDYESQCPDLREDLRRDLLEELPTPLFPN